MPADPCPLCTPDRQPNPATIDAMAAVEAGHVTTYTTAEAMFAAMGIDDPPDTRPPGIPDDLWDALCAIIEPGDLPRWLDTPNPAFSNPYVKDPTPIWLIREGYVQPLWNMVQAIAWGMN